MEIKLHDSVKSIELDDVQKQSIDILRNRYSELFYTLEFLCKTNSRETSLAKTKLEESLMWAVKSISRNHLHDISEYFECKNKSVTEYLKNDIESVGSNEEKN